VSAAGHGGGFLVWLPAGVDRFSPARDSGDGTTVARHGARGGAVAALHPVGKHGPAAQPVQEGLD